MVNKSLKRRDAVPQIEGYTPPPPPLPPPLQDQFCSTEHGRTTDSRQTVTRVGLTIPFEYKKKDLPCADIIAFFTSFTDVQDIA